MHPVRNNQSVSYDSPSLAGVRDVGRSVSVRTTQRSARPERMPTVIIPHQA